MALKMLQNGIINLKILMSSFLFVLLLIVGTNIWIYRSVNVHETHPSKKDSLTVSGFSSNEKDVVMDGTASRIKEMLPQESRHPSLKEGNDNLLPTPKEIIREAPLQEVILIN